MIIISIIIFLCIIGTILYCCIHVSTPYDRKIDDEEQMKFLRDLNERNE